MILGPVFCLLSINLTGVVSCGGNYTNNDDNDSNYFLDDEIVFDVDRFVDVLDGDNGLFFSV